MHTILTVGVAWFYLEGVKCLIAHSLVFLVYVIHKDLLGDLAHIPKTHKLGYSNTSTQRFKSAQFLNFNIEQFAEWDVNIVNQYDCTYMPMALLWSIIAVQNCASISAAVRIPDQTSYLLVWAAIKLPIVNPQLCRSGVGV